MRLSRMISSLRAAGCPPAGKRRPIGQARPHCIAPQPGSRAKDSDQGPRPSAQSPPHAVPNTARLRAASRSSLAKGHAQADAPVAGIGFTQISHGDTGSAAGIASRASASVHADQPPRHGPASAKVAMPAVDTARAERRIPSASAAPDPSPNPHIEIEHRGFLPIASSRRLCPGFDAQVGQSGSVQRRWRQRNKRRDRRPCRVKPSRITGTRRCAAARKRATQIAASRVRPKGRQEVAPS